MSIYNSVYSSLCNLPRKFVDTFNRIVRLCDCVVNGAGARPRHFGRPQPNHHFTHLAQIDPSPSISKIASNIGC